jgi:glyoxylase-like metal-dependent hydrolase (beta-lactamase superfamily II)
MDTLWGEFLPVDGSRLRVVQDAEEIVVGNLQIVALHTPGHAEHHCCYLFEDVCFTGDIGGVRIPGYPYLRAPMPPPELNIEKWHASLARLRKEKIARIAPTHFGIFDDPEWHFSTLEQTLDSATRWLEQTMPADPPVEEMRQSFSEWMIAEGVRMGLSEDVVRAYELANPSGMSADGLQRYWKKVKMAG